MFCIQRMRPLYVKIMIYRFSCRSFKEEEQEEEKEKDGENCGLADFRI